MRRRSGFTLIEILVVLTIMGVLFRIAMPHYMGIKRRAIAASIIGDVHAVRIGAMSYYTEHGEFPPQAGNGKVPPELESYLPANFSFKKSDWTYRWFHWNKTTGKGKNKVKESFVGVRVQSKDADLIAQLANSGGPGFVPIVTAKHVTFLVSSS